MTRISFIMPLWDSAEVRGQRSEVRRRTEDSRRIGRDGSMVDGRWSMVGAGGSHGFLSWNLSSRFWQPGGLASGRGQKEEDRGQRTEDSRRIGRDGSMVDGRWSIVGAGGSHGFLSWNLSSRFWQPGDLASGRGQKADRCQRTEVRQTEDSRRIGRDGSMVDGRWSMVGAGGSHGFLSWNLSSRFWQQRSLWRHYKRLVKNGITFLLILTFGWANAQTEVEVTRLELDAVIEWAQSGSISARRAATLQTTRYWEWRSFQASYKPRVQLNGTLPGFTRSFQEVVQQDGTIRFVSVSNNNANLGLSMSQPIASTGGTVFLGTSLQRFDNFKEDATFYNGAPIELGISQPIFAFNPLKWDKKIEPLRYQESQQEYMDNMEGIARNTVDFFFNLLIAQTNFQIAQTNLANTDTVYQITLEREKLGKASRNDVLQLRLETLKAKKAVAAAQQDLAQARQQMGAYVGKPITADLLLELPEETPHIVLDPARAIQETMVNRPDAIGFLRRELEAQAAVAEAKGQRGFTASLVGAFGLSGSGAQLEQVYTEAQDKESVFLQFNIPILDWGRAKSRLETAKAQQKLTIFEVEQDRVNLEQEVQTQVDLLGMFRQQLDLTREADEVAAARYQIAQDRFILGDLSITDLSIALQENVQAKRDYIRALWDFWRTHYYVRVLTLYDFEKQQKIKY